MILRGVTLFPFYYLGGGLWKICSKNDIEHRGANHFLPEKEKEMKTLLDAHTIPVFYFKMLFIYFKTLIQN